MSKVLQHRIEGSGIDIFGFPTPVEIAGNLLCRHEAPVDVGAAAARHTQRLERCSQPGQQLTAPLGAAEGSLKLIPRGLVDTRRQVAGDRVDRGKHSTTVLLCWIGCPAGSVTS